MIAPMEKLVLAGPKGRAKELLQSLQQAGVVHLETLRPEALSAYQLSPEERAELRRWEAEIGRASCRERVYVLV